MYLQIKVALVNSDISLDSAHPNSLSSVQFSPLFEGFQALLSSVSSSKLVFQLHSSELVVSSFSSLHSFICELAKFWFEREKKERLANLVFLQGEQGSDDRVVVDANLSPPFSPSLVTDPSEHGVVSHHEMRSHDHDSDPLGPDTSPTCLMPLRRFHACSTTDI
ncbi:hypothetical protein E2542_SST25454 [Spatholobus suberectus]|nr:hypothetical protein E2542_SST25454 [Spatholobus suberectus]